MEKKVKGRYDPYYYYREVKGNSTLTDFQLYRAKWELFPQFTIVDRMPLNVDIEVTTVCNLNPKCSYCQQSYDPPEPKHMDFEMVKRILDECAEKGVPAVRFNWRGEPLCYPYIIDAIAYAKQRGIIDVGINTNGMLLNLKLSEQLIKARLDKIIVTVHEQVDQDLLLELLKKFQETKWGYYYETPYLRIQSFNSSLGWEEIADHYGVKKLLNFEEESEDRTISDFKCPQLWQRLVIAVDGSIVPCCKALKGGTQLLERLGNFRTMSIEEAWHHPRLTGLRDFHRIRASQACSMCRMCGFRKEEIKCSTGRKY